jgi:hypothetical protein
MRTETNSTFTCPSLTTTSVCWYPIKKKEGRKDGLRVLVLSRVKLLIYHTQDEWWSMFENMYHNFLINCLLPWERLNVKLRKISYKLRYVHPSTYDKKIVNRFSWNFTLESLPKICRYGSISVKIGQKTNAAVSIHISQLACISLNIYRMEKNISTNSYK